MADAIDYESILKQMLDTIPNSIDKREGSVIYNTVSPVALQLAEQNYMLSYMFNLLFSDTAEGEWLDRVTNDFGIDREAATYSLRQINTFDSKGEPLDIAANSRFAIADITFKLTQRIDTGQYKAQAEQSGTIGNLYGGEILPIDNINGLGRAELISEPLIPSRDIETDESLRTRFYIAVRQTTYGGNIADYEKKTLEIDGVGAVKVFNALAMGAGNVGLIIGDEQGNRASQTLIDKVQVLFGINGNGIAPIGHTVIVGTSTDLAINVTAQIKVKYGASFTIVKPVVEDTIANYIGNIKFTDETIFYAKLVAEILNCHESIVDVGVVTMNNSSQNIALLKEYITYEVPTVGIITVSEAV